MASSLPSSASPWSGKSVPFRLKCTPHLQLAQQHQRRHHLLAWDPWTLTTSARGAAALVQEAMPLMGLDIPSALMVHALASGSVTTLGRWRTCETSGSCSSGPSSFQKEGRHAQGYCSSLWSSWQLSWTPPRPVGPSLASPGGCPRAAAAAAASPR